jgi:hypothetical protein
VKLSIDRISAGRGYVNPVLDVILRLKNTPSASEAENYAKVVESISYNAEDAWTNAPLSGTFPALTTELPSDPTVKKNDGQVLR